MAFNITCSVLLSNPGKIGGVVVGVVVLVGGVVVLVGGVVVPVGGVVVPLVGGVVVPVEVECRKLKTCSVMTLSVLVASS